MTKTVLPRSKIEVQMPPGAVTPRSGIYEEYGPRGGSTGNTVISGAGKPLPPTSKSGNSWKLVKQTSKPTKKK